MKVIDFLVIYLFDVFGFKYSYFVLGIPIGQQHLIWNNGELSDHQSLRDCSIPGGATLRLVLGMRGGPISTYRPSSAAAATIRFTPTVHFASRSSTSQKKTNSSNSTDDLPSTTTAVTTTSVPSLNENELSEKDAQKQITFYFVNSTDRLEFMRALDKHKTHTRETASATSLLGSDNTSEFPLKAPHPPISNNLLSTSKATQSLPFLKSEDTALSYCGEANEPQTQLASTTSEPSVIKATDSEIQKSSSPTTIAAAASLFAGFIYGRDTSYVSDTEDFLSPECNSSSIAPPTTYFLRPPSPEWDNRDLSTTPPITVPPTIDFPFFPPDVEGGIESTLEDDEEEEEEYTDSLADLKDCLVYYQSGGDLPFNSRRNGSYSYNWKGDADSPILTRAKVEECEFLAEKMRCLRNQMAQMKHERRRRLRQQQQLEQGGCDSNADEGDRSVILGKLFGNHTIFLN